jgi:peptidoglycan-N-acetylglucosamine deacetylase
VTFVTGVPVEEDPPSEKLVRLMAGSSAAPSTQDATRFAYFIFRSLLKYRQTKVSIRPTANSDATAASHVADLTLELVFANQGIRTCGWQARRLTLIHRMLSPLATGVYAGLGTLGVAGLAVGGFAYAARWPTSQIFGRTLVAARRPGELALTFDDGPNPAWTPRLLDILATDNVKATFFMVGRFAEAEKALARRVIEAGHLIGNHTWSHPDLSRTASGRVRDELMRTSNTLAQIVGQPIRYFRPPYGARRPVALRTAREMGMVPVLWNAMTSDWKESSAELIAQRLMRKIERNRSNGWATTIVLHDGRHTELGANRGPSVSAAVRLIAHYKASHRFVRVDAWSEENKP